MSANSIKEIVRKEAYKIVFWQFICIALFAASTAILYSLTSGFSVLLGGMAYGLPNLFFVWRVFRYGRAHEMTKFLVAFMTGEMIKLILCGILFLLIVKYLPVSLLSVIVGLAGAMISFWIVCLGLFSKQVEKRSG